MPNILNACKYHRRAFKRGIALDFKTKPGKLGPGFYTLNLLNSLILHGRGGLSSLDAAAFHQPVVLTHQ